MIAAIPIIRPASSVNGTRVNSTEILVPSYMLSDLRLVLRVAEAEALGRSLDLIIPENLRERHWQGYRATLRTGQSRYGDGQILSVPAARKDGTRISVEFTIVPFTDDAGRMIGIAAIMRDATARFEELRALRRQLALHSAADQTDSGNSRS